MLQFDIHADGKIILFCVLCINQPWPVDTFRDDRGDKAADHPRRPHGLLRTNNNRFFPAEMTSPRPLKTLNNREKPRRICMGIYLS